MNETKKSLDISQMSLRIQNALLKNVQIESRMKPIYTQIEHNKTKKLRQIIEHRRQVENYLENSVQCRSQNFEKSSAEEILNMINNRSQYTSGKWQGAVEGLKLMKRRKLVISAVNMKKNMPGQAWVG